MINLSIIIPVKNEAVNLRACLDSIRQADSTSINYEILVIDNGSDDATVGVAKEFEALVHVVPDVTVAGLRNVGAGHAKGTILVFIDADCTVGYDWFKFIAPYLSDDAAKVFGSPPGIPVMSTWVQKCWYQIRRRGSVDNPVVDVDWLESMNLFVRQDLFAKVGGFDVNLVTCEDYDLCMRLKKHSDITSDARIQAVHHGEAKTIQRFYEKERWRGVSNLSGFRSHDFSLAELPSLLFPLAQLSAIVIVLIALLLAIFDYIPIGWCMLLILCWQIPLLYLAFKKNKTRSALLETGGIWLLVNVYLIARGQSLFMGAAWK